MGSGGTMRAAGKMAGMTVGTRGRRVFTGDNFPVPSFFRRVSSSHPEEDVKLVVSQTNSGVQRPAISEIDDWVFAGLDEDLADPMPRVVFTGAPTLQEAKEATSELADALEKIYLSSPKLIGFEGLSIADNDSSLSLSSSQVVENKACVTMDNVVAPAVPRHAIKAFKFLQESPAVQNVVASIACDSNVWNAVLQNHELQEFLNSQRTSEYEGVVTESDLDQSSAKSFGDSSEYKKSEPGGGSMNFVQKIKSSVVDMMHNLSDFFQNFFGGQGFNKVFVNANGTAKVTADTIMEASFTGLAVMAIMVILLKRG